METNILDGYISKSYSIDSFKKTYAHCLQPVEGQLAWPVSDRPRPVGPNEIKKPGRKKKNRTREEQEKPKSTKVSKVGTVIRCGLCKRPGHNRSSCFKRHGIDSTSTAAPSGSANPPNPPAMASGSTTNKGKKKATSETSTKMNQAETSKKRSRSTHNTSGNTINVHGSSSVTVNVGSGHNQATNNPERRYRKRKHGRIRNLLGFQD